MFKCSKCGQTSRQGEKPTKFVVETREKDYVIYDDHGTEYQRKKGSEIAKEVVVCSQCYKELTNTELAKTELLVCDGNCKQSEYVEVKAKVPTKVNYDILM